MTADAPQQPPDPVARHPAGGPGRSAADRARRGDAGANHGAGRAPAAGGAGPGGRHRRWRAAAALRYAPAEDAAPRVVAAGFGAMAEAILRRAREAGVPLVRSPLAPILARVPPGQAIPPALYEVVARIMALALEVDRQLAESRGLAERWGLTSESAAPAAPPAAVPPSRAPAQDGPRPPARSTAPGPGGGAGAGSAGGAAPAGTVRAVPDPEGGPPRGRR